MRAAALAALLIGSCGGPAAVVAPPTAPALIATPIASSSVSAPPPVSAPPVEPTVIAVRYRAADDRWELGWELGEPAAALRFERTAAIARAGSWRPGAGLALIDDAHGTALVATDGAPRTRFTAVVATDDRSPTRLPPLHVRFTDGARLIDLGAVAADAELCDADRCGPILRPRRWELASPGRHLRVGDRHAAEALAWDEPRDRPRIGFAYVGAAVGVDGAAATVVGDGGLPRWLAAETEALVAAVVPALAARTGLALPAPPVVYAALTPGRRRGVGVRGRAVPGALVLEAQGDWRRDRIALRRLWRELVVHEALHLWNGQVARRADRKDEWLSEGASTFVAGVELRAAGFLDARRYGQRVVAAANRCARALTGPLYADGADAAYYPCGELILVAIDRANAARGGAMAVLAGLYRDAAATARGSYATIDLWPRLAQSGVAPETIAAWRALVEQGPGPEPRATMQAILAEAGVVTRVVGGRRPRLRFVRWAPPL